MPNAEFFSTNEHGRVQRFYFPQKSRRSAEVFSVTLSVESEKQNGGNFAFFFSLRLKKCEFQCGVKSGKTNPGILGKKRGVSYSYRTATTSYLCYVPVLED